MMMMMSKKSRRNYRATHDFFSALVALEIFLLLELELLGLLQFNRRKYIIRLQPRDGHLPPPRKHQRGFHPLMRSWLWVQLGKRNRILFWCGKEAEVEEERRIKICYQSFLLILLVVGTLLHCLLDGVQLLQHDDQSEDGDRCKS